MYSDIQTGICRIHEKYSVSSFDFFDSCCSTVFLSRPAKSAIITYQGRAGGSLPTVGYRFTVAGISGRPVNFLSIKSSVFPLTPIQNNNSSEVSVSLLGSVLQPGDPYTLQLDIADNPDGSSGYNFSDVQAFFGTPTGIQVQDIPALSFQSSTSQAASTPFSECKSQYPVALTDIDTSCFR